MRVRLPTHICVTRPQWVNQCWLIFSWNLWDKPQWKLNQNTTIFIQENALENVISKISVKIEPKYKDFHSGKCIRKCHQWNVSHFVSASMVNLKIEARTEWPLFCRQNFQIVLYEDRCILIQISVKCVPVCLFDNMPALFQIMAWHWSGNKPFDYLNQCWSCLLMHICIILMHICITLHQSSTCAFLLEKISMALCKNAVSPLLMHWRYCSLALTHRYHPITALQLEQGQFLKNPHCKWHGMSVSLTYCGLATPYGDRDLGQHWLR